MLVDIVDNVGIIHCVEVRQLNLILVSKNVFILNKVNVCHLNPVRITQRYIRINSYVIFYEIICM